VEAQPPVHAPEAHPDELLDLLLALVRALGAERAGEAVDAIGASLDAEVLGPDHVVVNADGELAAVELAVAWLLGDRARGERRRTRQAEQESQQGHPE